WKQGPDPPVPASATQSPPSGENDRPRGLFRPEAMTSGPDWACADVVPVSSKAAAPSTVKTRNGIAAPIETSTARMLPEPTHRVCPPVAVPSSGESEGNPSCLPCAAASDNSTAAGAMADWAVWIGGGVLGAARAAHSSRDRQLFAGGYYVTTAGRTPGGWWAMYPELTYVEGYLVLTDPDGTERRLE